MLALCLALPKLGQGDFNVDTGRYAAIALQAWRSAASGDVGALLTLREAGGVAYFNKPPLVFWLHGPFLLAAGPRLWAARLPGVVAVVGAVCGLAWMVRRACAHPARGGVNAAVGRESGAAAQRAAVLAGCVLATTYAFTSLSHAISPDLWQAAFLVGAMAPAVAAVRRECGAWLVLSGVGVGLALLAKPLVAFVAPLILVAWLAWEGRFRWIGWVAAGVAVALLIAAPWHAAIVALHGRDFAGQYFGREIVGRAAGELAGTNDGAGSPLYYPIVLAKVYWPWLPVLILALAWAARGGSPRRWRPWVRLAIVWMVICFVALTLHPDKRPRYLALVYAPAAWLIGMWLATLRGTAREFVSGGLRAAGPVAVAAALLVAVLPIRVHGGTPSHWREFFAWHSQAGEPVLWEGGVGLPETSRLYLREGCWPEPTHDGLGRLIASPPAGALIMYHHRHAIQPGEGEEIVFRSEDGDVFVTRLVGTAWRPRGDAGGEWIH